MLVFVRSFPRNSTFTDSLQRQNEPSMQIVTGWALGLGTFAASISFLFTRGTKSIVVQSTTLVLK